jgi:hypothetical protein
LAVNVGRALSTWPGRLSALAALFGLLLFLALFLSWGQIVCVREPCPYPSGWQTLRVLDIPIAVLAAAAVVVGVMAFIGRGATATLLLLAVIGLAAVVVVLAVPLVERQDQPLFDFGGGWTLALVASLLLLGSGVVGWATTAGAFEDEESGGGEEGGEDEDEESGEHG